MFLPISQVKLTNVALIRYKISKKKFEITCYKNKAINWRNGVETDLDEVLQVFEVFADASQGLIASKNELSACFPGRDKREIIQLILEKGDLQVSDKERVNNLDNKHKDVINFLAEKCVHPLSKRCISVESIIEALKDIHFQTKEDQPSKKQALEAFKKLKRKYNIVRAQMKVKIISAIEHHEDLIAKLKELNINYEEIQQGTQELSIEALIEPKNFRILDQILKSYGKKGYLEVLIPAVANKEVTNIEEAGVVNLEIRADYKEGDELLSSDSDKEIDLTQNNQKKFKKDRRKKKEKKQLNEQKIVEKKDQQQEEEKKEIPIENYSSSSLICHACANIQFQSKEEFRQHFKSDWHRFNLKQKQENKTTLNEIDYINFQFDQDFLNKKEKKQNHKKQRNQE